MTDTAINGAAPAAAEQDGGQGAPRSERILGAIGLAFALAVGVIAVDMLTGGAISRLFARAEDTEDGG